MRHTMLNFINEWTKDAKERPLATSLEIIGAALFLVAFI